MSTWIIRFTDWLDDRTGYKQLTHETLYENIPGGSRWIYITGSMLVFAFVTQVVTGLFLWMGYSPGSQNAWESVYYITNEMHGGWLLRGVHHYMAQAMVVLLPLHLLQVVLCRAYTAPREINYWLGLVLMQIVLALGLTGYLLPWDQKGYWATKVATELMSLPPGGGYIQKVVVGGSEYGHATLTRFFAMHAGVLPTLLVLVLGLHVLLFRKHGITAKHSEKRPDEFFWPKQVFKDAVGCFVMLLVTVILTCTRGAELGPPAEPTESYGAARPEWYFLFLFQLLKHSPNNSEFIGAIVIPGAVMGFLFALPIIARIKFGHIVNCVVILVLMCGAGYLTYEAIDHDNYAAWHPNPPADPTARDLWQERKRASVEFRAAQKQAHHEYQRMEELVSFYGIPKEGAAVSLVRNDPEIQGPRLFKQNCASCHSYLDSNQQGIPGPQPPAGWAEDPNHQPFGAPNLYGFASREWIAGLLDAQKIVGSDYFGYTAHVGGEMATFVKDSIQPNDPDIVSVAAALSAEAALVSQREPEASGQETINAGRELVASKFACTDCHKFRDQGELGAAPDLTGYGSYQWLTEFIANPRHERFYRDTNDRMPAFAEHPDEPVKNQLTAREIDLLVRWLRGDDRALSAKLPPTTGTSSAPEPLIKISPEAIHAR